MKYIFSLLDIDYCGYGVLPMAIQPQILLTVGKSPESRLRLINIESEKYPEFERPCRDRGTRTEEYHHLSYALKPQSAERRKFVIEVLNKCRPEAKGDCTFIFD